MIRQKQISHIARVIWLVGKLMQASVNHPISVSTLVQAYEDEFNDSISDRSIQRDIELLREALFPVVPVSEGRKTAYYLEGVIDKSISEEELKVLLAAQQFCPKNADGTAHGSLYEQVGVIIDKFRKILTEEKQNKIDELEKRLYAFSPLGLPWKMYSEIMYALINHYIVKITYHALHNDEITDRFVEPVGLYSTRDKWVLVAFCRLRNDFREFRVDRIQHLTFTSEKIKEKQYQELESYFKERWSYWAKED